MLTITAVGHVLVQFYAALPDLKCMAQNKSTVHMLHCGHYMYSFQSYELFGIVYVSVYVLPTN